jgi:hypothetical protein
LFRTTLKLQRENYCARIITSAIRKYAAVLKQRKLELRILEKATVEELTSCENSPVHLLFTTTRV